MRLLYEASTNADYREPEKRYKVMFMRLRLSTISFKIFHSTMGQYRRKYIKMSTILND